MTADEKLIAALADFERASAYRRNFVCDQALIDACQAVDDPPDTSLHSCIEYALRRKYAALEAASRALVDCVNQMDPRGLNGRTIDTVAALSALVKP